MNLLTRKNIFKLTILLAFVFVFPQNIKAQSSLSISDVSDNSGTYSGSSVPKFEKLEIKFTLNNTVANNLQFPYDPATPNGITPSSGVSVDAEFTPDNWVTIYKQPGFYYQEYQNQTKENQDWIYPTGKFYWVVRFAPNKTGSWKYRVSAQDASGKVVSGEFSFNVVGSTNHGFVKVSENDSRYFEFDDGTYFPGLGYNLNFDGIDWKNPIQSNQNNLQIMGQNGIQFIRIWLSQWQIFGAEWNAWKYPHDASGGLWSHLRYQEAYPGSEVSMRIAIAADGIPCMASGNWLSAPLGLKPNTTYRVKARVKTIDLSGPVETGKPFGFVVKTGSLLWNGAKCESPDQGTRMTASLNQNSDWTVVEGTYQSGNRNYLDGIFVTLENLSAGEAYIDSVWMKEDTGSWDTQPNVLAQPWMAHHQYYDQRMSYAFDLALNLAKQNGVYLKPVLTEKNDWILNSIDFNGNFISNFGNDNYYGNFRQMTKTRWLLQSWWRYVQARWGYSTAIQSWELLNEGDPWNGRHYTLADEFGIYMKCSVFGQPVVNTNGWRCAYQHPNFHPVTTSTWHSFPQVSFWKNSNYPNVDIADFHLYYQKNNNSTAYVEGFGDVVISTPNTWYDTALVAKTQSDVIGAKTTGGANKPTVIGESGFVTSGSEPAASDLNSDTSGVWLHNYLWAGLASSGVYNAGYWYIQGHIYSSTYDHRSKFGNVYRFIKDIPLNNGNYQDITASSSNQNVRAWGQKDIVNKRAHLWISNKNHTWKNVVDNVGITPENASITFGGFAPNSSYKLEKWNTYSGVVSQTSNTNSDSSGNIVIAVSNLTSDEAYRIGDYSITVTPTPTAKPGDANGDGKVDGADYVIWLTHYNQNVSGPVNGDFNNSGSVDGADYVIWLNNYGI